MISRSHHPSWRTGLCLLALMAAAAGAASEAFAAPPNGLRALLALDPSDAPDNAVPNPALVTPESLSRAAGTRITMTHSSNTRIAMQAGTSAEYDVLIAPSHVAGTALRNGYTLVATSGRTRAFVLVAATGVDEARQLFGKRLYLPQTDSLHSFVAKSMLAEAGVPLATFAKVTQGNTASGGLIALGLGVADVTIADAEQAHEWIAKNPGKGHVLKTSRPLPGGMNIVVRNDVCPAECARLAAWVQSPEGSIAGIGRFKVATPADAQAFAFAATDPAASPRSAAAAPGLPITTAKLAKP